MQNDNKDQISSIRSEYMKIFIRISGWIIGPVIISLIIGKSLDGHYNTSPWITFVCLTLSFTFSMIMIVRIAQKYIKDDLKEKDTPKI